MKKWSKAGMVCAAILAAGMAVTACGGGNTAKTDNTGAVETEKKAEGEPYIQAYDHNRNTQARGFAHSHAAQIRKGRDQVWRSRGEGVYVWGKD